MSDNAPNAEVPAEFVTFKHQLPHFAAALESRGSVRIVAMGSSSTAGREDVRPYPHRVEMYLRIRYGNPKIDVVNRGRGGEDADLELLRFDADIFAEKPSLVIWQIGTNAVFHNQNIEEIAAKIDERLQRLRGQPMDVILIDPQYVTAMLLDDKAVASERMVSLIAAAAERANVNLFRRWALMRHWHVHNNIGFDRMIDQGDPDKLHQNDWSTFRISKALSEAIVARAPLAAA